MTPSLPATAVRRRARTVEPVPYDFRRPLTLSREHARHLSMALQRFARLWGTQLTARLRALVQVTFDDVTLVTYDEHVGSLPTPTALFVCTVEQPRGTAVLQLPVATTLVWVDYLFGGTGLGDDREGRELTEIETTVVGDLLAHALGDLAYTFAAIMPLELSVRSVQYNPQFVQAVAATDAVLSARFTLRVGEERVDTATLMLPAEPVLAALRAEQRPEGDEPSRERVVRDRADLERATLEAPVEVAVRCTPRTVHPRDVVDLTVGDVLPLSHPASRPLEVVVDGVVLAHAAAGTHGSRIACQVVSVEENHA
ncbi:flagellar motor switch protein FliM [Cellulomonas wangsupingiae]|uniref:Flagellar motor switch protein FliM n=1 Tax=Cellulomonas wangsupingiae TaxID=2968085 RepID=A0ABY5K9Q0_9CELL|nr:flagellar motor switch protein FliM [Cellulomonas wangsupingiae]MCC2334163.1 flagellar motor switch protein FliM [Cellulomonas wangsupingiae]UUI65842.1 flagellar motor switch protein FliM [Cellulomonas wangsupingiae]